MRWNWLMVCCAAWMTTVSACSDTEEIADGAADVSGDVTGVALPDGTKVAVLWVVSTESPDRQFLFGAGDVQDGRYAIDLPESLPAGALNDSAFGVGVIAFFSPNTELPVGELTSEQLDVLFTEALGLSTSADIYRADRETDIHEWHKDFSLGFSCGACQPSGSDNVHDTFTPVSCEDLEVDVGSDICEWT